MRSRIATCILLLCFCWSLPAAAQTAPYDAIERAYAPYMSSTDPLAFPMKVRSIAADPYKFWRGSKDLFFLWCKSQTSDWLSDRSAYLTNHGDLHLGNIGSYASEEGWGKLAFGMVDFDDSAKLPFQLELLQGLITLELTGRQNKLSLSEADEAKLADTLLARYRVAVNSKRTATAMLKDESDAIVLKLLKRSQRSYQDELDSYIKDGKFRTSITSESGKPKEILTPAEDRADEIAGGIAAAIVNCPELADMFRISDRGSIRSAMKDVALRTRLGSSGSQGLKKYLVLLDHPLKSADHDAILYLKKEIPTAAERSGIVLRDPRSPGQRAKQDMDHLTEPRALANGWCEIGGESYWVTFKEPWSDELDPDSVKTFDDLLHMASIWGTVAGATHREEGRYETILPRLTPQLRSQLRERSKRFIKQLDDDFRAFRADPRVAAHLAATDATVLAGQPSR